MYHAELLLRIQRVIGLPQIFYRIILHRLHWRLGVRHIKGLVPKPVGHYIQSLIIVQGGLIHNGKKYLHVNIRLQDPWSIIGTIYP